MRGSLLRRPVPRSANRARTRRPARGEQRTSRRPAASRPPALPLRRDLACATSREPPALQAGLLERGLRAARPWTPPPRSGGSLLEAARAPAATRRAPQPDHPAPPACALPRPVGPAHPRAPAGRTRDRPGGLPPARCRSPRTGAARAPLQPPRASPTMKGPLTEKGAARLTFQASYKPIPMITIPIRLSKPPRKGSASENTNNIAIALKNPLSVGAGSAAPEPDGVAAAGLMASVAATPEGFAAAGPGAGLACASCLRMAEITRGT